MGRAMIGTASGFVSALGSEGFLLLIAVSAIGYYLHGAWNLVDEAVCGVIVGVPWMIGVHKFGNGLNALVGLAATATAVMAAALLPAWSIPEVVIVGFLALAG